MGKFKGQKEYEKNRRTRAYRKGFKGVAPHKKKEMERVDNYLKREGVILTSTPDDVSDSLNLAGPIAMEEEGPADETVISNQSIGADEPSPFLMEEEDPVNETVGNQSIGADEPNTIFPTGTLPGNRIVNLAHLFTQLKNDVHKPFMCTIADMDFIREVPIKKHSIMTVQLLFQCRMCNSTRKYALQPNDENIEGNLVNGVISGGVGFAAAEPIFAALNIPFMSERKFMKEGLKVSERIGASLSQSMAAAAAEEKQLALEAGDVLPDGTPFITVVADGMWAKRSYKTKYNSLSGMASIIGYRTRKVVFVGTRNKFCSLCCGEKKTGKKAPHKCFRNWKRSSTAMEADIIVEGFRRSIQTQGIAYTRLIGDGDSSVMKRLLGAQPYGFTVAIKKVECRNHLLRNMDGHLRGFLKATKFPIAERKALASNVFRFRQAVRGAIKHWKNAAGLSSIRCEGLHKDILNAPKHILGLHHDCLEYYCKEKGVNESSLYNVMTKSGLADDLIRLMTRVAHHADSLLLDVDSNLCEQLNSLANKLIGGKRIFYGARGSYNMRMEAACLQFNEGAFLADVARRICNIRTPGSRTKGYVSRAKLRTEHNRRRRELFKRSKPTQWKEEAGPDEDYGDVEDIPDIPESQLRQSKERFLEELSSVDPEELQLRTMGQDLSEDWMVERVKRLTASNFGKVMCLRPTTSTRNTVKSILYSDISRTQAVKFGKTNEDLAREIFCCKNGKKVKKCGLFVDPTYPFLAASPDGLVCGEDALLEIKCLWAATKAETTSLADAVRQKKTAMLKLGEKGVVQLKPKSYWHYQIQGQLNILKVNKCYLFIYTPHWQEVIEVTRDQSLWRSVMVPKLERFYKEALLCEIVSPRYTLAERTNDIRQAFLSVF